MTTNLGRFNTNTTNLKEVRRSFRAIQSIFDVALVTPSLGFLRLDASNGPLTGTLGTQKLDPSANNTYDIGTRLANRYKELNVTDANFFGSIALNDGGGQLNGAKIVIQTEDDTNNAVTGIKITQVQDLTFGIASNVGINVLVKGQTDGAIPLATKGTTYVVSAESPDDYISTVLAGHQMTMQSLSAQTGTIADSSAFRAELPIWSGSTPTTVRGFHALDQGDASATDSYGLLLEDQTSSTNPWSIGIQW